MTNLMTQPMTRRELLAAGLTDGDLRRLLAFRELRSVFRGIYVGAGVEDTVGMRAAAAAKIIGPQQVVCDRSAAYLHGVDVYGVRESKVGRLETCVRSGDTPSRRGGVDGRERDLADRDVMSFGPVLVTTPLRTALDLGCALPRHRAIGVLDAFVQQHDLDPAALIRESGRYVGRRGVVQLRELLPLVRPEAESPRESWLRLVILDAGLPMPTLQWWVIVVTKDELKAGVDAPWIQGLRELLVPQTRRFRWEIGKDLQRI